MFWIEVVFSVWGERKVSRWMREKQISDHHGCCHVFVRPRGTAGTWRKSGPESSRLRLLLSVYWFRYFWVSYNSASSCAGDGRLQKKMYWLEVFSLLSWQEPRQNQDEEKDSPNSCTFYCLPGGRQSCKPSPFPLCSLFLKSVWCSWAACLSV